MGFDEILGIGQGGLLLAIFWRMGGFNSDVKNIKTRLNKIDSILSKLSNLKIERFL